MASGDKGIRGAFRMSIALVQASFTAERGLLGPAEAGLFSGVLFCGLELRKAV
ncbi:hypothetical protein M2232_004571 [Bradyrhizobium japonicum]|nr:hypothetical protein [Bradyrhizobium japonicum]MCS3960084.1 hypothetical protein [Bradyrhizobium japonicum]MCS4001837.1 hypothetical protein [Bradyrhizobium japonicum]MCW2221039.1 hypothetical protein [Bradyrhizobium japonicum]MCW2345651.1 hypothetical protein [Bradyrhizobium japonicum]